MKKRSQRGFTLIELMLVIVIITIMMMSAFRTMQEKATALQVQNAAQAMQSYLAAAQDYYIQNGYWPGASATAPGSITDANADTTSALYSAGYISTSAIPTSPWGTAYVMCPYAPNTSDTVESFTCVGGPTVTGGNVSFRIFMGVPASEGKGVPADIAALLPNGIVESGTTFNTVQGSVLGPGGTQDMANYVKNATTVQPICYDATQYSPSSSTVCPSSSQCWPPPMSGSTPQISAPTGTDCPAGWIPQVYVMTTGFNSAQAQGYQDPSSGNNAISYLAGYYAVPVTRYSSTTNTSGQHLISGWDIYSASIQQGGVTSASVCSPVTTTYSTVGGVTTSTTTSGPPSQGGLVTVMTKCVPAVDTTTKLPTSIPAYQTGS